MGEPNCFRYLIYLVVVSRQTAAPPSEQLAILSLPPSKPYSAILNPCPLEPIKFDFGTFTSSKLTTLVG